MKLLTLSNGHGEDEVAVRVLRQLRHCCPTWEIQALPIVGEGQAYQHAQIPIFGTVRAPLPSGGFFYMDQRQFWRDLQSGLLSLTWTQLQACRQWATEGGVILAVGDIVPLLFAGWSGAPYAFIGTAKSEYYLRTEFIPPQGKAIALPWRRWLDCVYLPWERALMQIPRCKAVFPRDRLTATVLQQWSIPVQDLGNPMMDDLEPQGLFKDEDRLPAHTGTVLLLPGSRPPEAYENWALMLEGITPLAQQGHTLLFVGAIAPLLAFEPLVQVALDLGWHPHEPLLDSTVPHCWLTLNHCHLCVLKRGFADALHLADVSVAMAGTATEQCVGYGIPVITLPGKGPQFVWKFAEAQARLLGRSIHLVELPSQIPEAVVTLLQSTPAIDYHTNGQQRMGTPGASQRIAQHLQHIFSGMHPESSVKAV